MQNSSEKTKEDAIKNLQVAAEKIKEQEYDKKTGIKDIVKAVIFFFFAIAIGFGWMMLMLLIISFVSLGYLHMHLDRMIIVSAICGICTGIWYLFRGRK